MANYTPRRIELANGWLKVRGCMLQSFAHFLWLKYFKPRDGNSTEFRLHEECHIVERGALVSALLHIRILNDFFSPVKFSTDINASQYPRLRNPGAFLSEAEAKDLDKHIAHITKERVSIASQGWYPPDLISRAYDCFEVFAAYVKDDFFKGQPDNVKRVDGDCSRIKLLLDEQTRFYEQ
jgi:hypothetical protein